MKFKSRCILVAACIGLCSAAFADTIEITSTASPTIALNPSSDTLSLSAGDVTITGPGHFALQTGNFYIGNSDIPDQMISFSFNETLTVNGVTKTVTIFGQDNVTQTADVLTFFAGTPVNFGNYYTVTLDSSSYYGNAAPLNMPVTLSAEVTVTPEPTPLALLGTGLCGGVFYAAMARRRSHHDPEGSRATMEYV